MFTQTRLRITAVYTLIIVFISLFFSTAIYRLATSEINRVESRIRLRQNMGMIYTPATILYNQEIIDEAKTRIIQELLVINLIIFLGSSALSFWLSGLTLRPIAQTLESQKRFIGDASHELKTPIATIKTSLEVYLRGKTKTLATAQDLLSDTLHDINHLDNLTRQLLLLNTQTNLKKETIKPTDILNHTLDKLKPLAQKKNITFTTKFSNNSLFLNSQALEQIAIILLDNAVKFSPAKSTIQVNFTKTILKITDSGIGIKPEDLDHIFDRFYQADTARTKANHTGHGLGLSIAQKLCDQNGWSISTTSRPGSGSIFTVKF